MARLLVSLRKAGPIRLASWPASPAVVQRLMNRAERVVESMIVEPLEWVREQGIVLQSHAAQCPIWPNMSPVNPSAAAGGDTRPATKSSRYQPRPQLAEVIATRLVNERSRSSTAAYGQLSFVSRPLPQGTLGCRRQGAHCLGRPPNHRNPLSRMGPCPRNHRREATHCRRRAHPTASLPPLTRQVGQACDGLAGRGHCPQVLGSDHRQPTGTSRR